MLKGAVHEDWENREYINSLQSDVRVLMTTLQKFDYTARLKLANLDEKLVNVERRLEFLSAQTYAPKPQEG